MLSAAAVSLFGWLCWYISDAKSAVTSLRLCMVLAVAAFIGVLAGTVGALYGWVCWVVLVGPAVTRFVARFGHRMAVATGDVRRPNVSMPHAIMFAVAAYAVWPSIVRPPTDGDTLIYHLSNAASWLHAHSLWTSSTTYWWYPPMMELAVATVLATCGWYALPRGAPDADE